VGDDISILSDKAYRKASENLFEAVGNVIITHYKEVLYGESASFKLDSGDINVEGNVRYIGPGHTLFGSTLLYNSKTQYLTVSNARIQSSMDEGDFSVVGSVITRVNPTEYIARNAEYSTCRDCPESWSIYGEKVRITVGEYVRIRHALIKVKGVTVMYMPYLVLPIKKKRQTGLLFPKFSIRLNEGVGYKQPWFWAVSDQTDMLFTPAALGRRGLAHEYRFRHYYGDHKWSEVQNLQARDRIYDPDLPEKEETSGQHVYRQFSDYEHHFSFGQWFNHHAQYSFTNDLDIGRDFGGYTDQFLRGSEVGGGGWMEWRQNIFDINFESYYNRNLITQKNYGFDHDYVQILPQINFHVLPISILQTDVPMFQYLSMDLESTYTIFKQNDKNEEQSIRNANRWTMIPKINWQMFTMGPFSLKTTAEFDYARYDFFRLDPEQAKTDPIAKFEKTGQVVKSELSMEIDKIFGIAYEEKIPMEKIDQESKMLLEMDRDEKPDDQAKLFKDSIDRIPPFDQSLTDDFYLVRKNSYRHVQEVKLNHYFIADEKLTGRESFKKQITSEAGQFDYRDSIRSQSHVLGDVRSQTGISERNTIELQLNNTLIKKSSLSYDPYRPINSLRDTFSYDKMAYFNVSQGYELNNRPDTTFEDRITRLYISTGLSLDKFSFGFSEYYFWQDHRNVLSFNFNKKFLYGSLNGRYDIDPLSTPKSKRYNIGGSLQLLAQVELEASTTYDLIEEKYTESTTRVLYKPHNNCWRVEATYSKTEIDSSIGFNFFINFAGNNFVSLTGI
jgi:LPS-assembly protein